MTENQTLNRLASSVLGGVDRILSDSKWDGLIAQGDTTTCAFASLAAFHKKLPVFHVEAGLRSENIDSPYPEEFNRRMVSLATRGHFCPTPAARENLLRENVSDRDIVVTGNTGIDALLMTRAKALVAPVYAEKPFILTTLHRRESFGAPLRAFFNSLKQIAGAQSLNVILPLHLNPNVRLEAENVFGSTSGWVDCGNGSIYLCEPLDYSTFVCLMDRAQLIITDSGGIQEEATTLGKPMIICRERTERPEALTQANVTLVKTGEELFAVALRILDSKMDIAPSAIFGDGKASMRIVEGIERFFDRGSIN